MQVQTNINLKPFRWWNFNIRKRRLSRPSTPLNLSSLNLIFSWLSPRSKKVIMILIENRYSQLIGTTANLEQWSSEERKRVPKSFWKVIQKWLNQFSYLTTNHLQKRYDIQLLQTLITISPDKFKSLKSNWGKNIKYIATAFN